MSSHDKEINALLTLLDDPDKEVFETVEQRLMSFGHSIIPNLEDYWEQSPDNALQDRIEMLIHRIHFNSLQTEFSNWAQGESDLLYGAFLVAKYQYPELQHTVALKEIENIRRNIWLEMNSYLTPLEQIKVVESILYGFYKMRGGELNYKHSNDFMIHEVIQTKKGNALTNGILYLALAELLDMPVRAINIPRQFVLGWFSHQSLFENNFVNAPPSASIKIFIDPNSGFGFSQKDINLYLKRIAMEPNEAYYFPQSNKQIIKMLLQQFALCFDDETYRYKKIELEQLAGLIAD